MATATKSKRADTNGRATVIEVAELPIISFNMRFRGITPLILDRFPERAAEAIEDSQTGAGRAPRTARDPEAEFQDAIYYMPDQTSYGFPGTGIKKAIKAAAMRMTGGEQKGTVVVAAFNVVAAEGRGLVPLIADDPLMRRDHVVRQGKGNIVYRPEFWPWSMDVPITLYLPSLSLPEFVQLARMAGFGIGLGNWRPEKGGSSGTFEVEIHE